MQARFAYLAMQASVMAGSAWMFMGSQLAFVVWLVWGSAVGWRESVHLWPTSLLTWFTWQALILVQHSQISEQEALHRKVDELIRAVDKADNRLIGLEKRPLETGGV
jgi:low affinity Fe/Cu permease